MWLNTDERSRYILYSHGNWTYQQDKPWWNVLLNKCSVYMYVNSIHVEHSFLVKYYCLNRDMCTTYLLKIWCL